MSRVGVVSLVMADMKVSAADRFRVSVRVPVSGEGMKVRDLQEALNYFNQDMDVLIQDGNGGFVAIDRVEADIKFDKTPCVVIRQW
jgi:hypothetical protein